MFPHTNNTHKAMTSTTPHKQHITNSWRQLGHRTDATHYCSSTPTNIHVGCQVWRYIKGFSSNTSVCFVLLKVSVTCNSMVVFVVVFVFGLKVYSEYRAHLAQDATSSREKNVRDCPLPSLPLPRTYALLIFSVTKILQWKWSCLNFVCCCCCCCCHCCFAGTLRSLWLGFQKNGIHSSPSCLSGKYFHYYPNVSFFRSEYKLMSWSLYRCFEW